MFRKIGIDKAILFTSSTSSLGMIGGIMTIIFVVKFMTDIEQGYYYTFGSLIAIQLFFELGLSGILIQYVAHEKASVDLEHGKFLNNTSLSRISSLFHFSIRWYLFFSILLFLALIFFGIFFFNKFSSGSDTIWEIPWIILALATSLNLLICPFTAFLQGLGKVEVVASYQFMAQILRFIIIFIGIPLGFNLYVLGISSLVNFLIIFFCVFKNFFQTFNNLWKFPVSEKVNYFTEIFPFQWKIALSWISGYFIFQLFTPAIFASDGPIAAGQMGVSLTVLNGIFALSFSWMTTKIPMFSEFIAKKEFSELDLKFNKTLKQSAIINIFFLLLFFSLIAFLRYFDLSIMNEKLGFKFLDLLPLFLLILTFVINHFVASWGIYLRCHKKEPFLICSIVGSILCALSTLIFGNLFGVIGIVTGYFFINLIMLPFLFYIFNKKRVVWHLL